MSSQRNPSVRFRKAGSSLRSRSSTYFESIQRSFMANLPSTFVDQYPSRPEKVHDHLLNLLSLVLDSPARRHRATSRLSGAREDDKLLGRAGHRDIAVDAPFDACSDGAFPNASGLMRDRKSTRLNS